MNASGDESEPKIIVDEDWKEQVQKEKEQLRQAAQQQGEEAAAEAGDENTPPPASFTTLVSMLFTQSMAMLGQIPDPATGEPTVNKVFAKHYIDTLEMLETKTQGNLDEEEAKMLGEALHALRMTFVSVKSPEKS